jgi:hypothetical protein
MGQRLGSAGFIFPETHAAVRPKPVSPPHQLYKPLHRRVIKHLKTKRIHLHIAAPWPRVKISLLLASYTTADGLYASWRAGDNDMLYRSVIPAGVLGMARRV